MLAEFCGPDFPVYIKNPGGYKTIPLGEFVHTDPTWAYLDINGQIALAEGINEGGSGTWQEWNDTDVWLAGWKLPF